MYLPGFTPGMANLPSILELTPVASVLSGLNNTTEADNTGSLVSSSIIVPLTVTFCAHRHVAHRHNKKVQALLLFPIFSFLFVPV